MKWNAKETTILVEKYKTMEYKDLLELLPARTEDGIKKKLARLGLRKYDGDVYFKHNNGYIVVRCDDYPEDLPGWWYSAKQKARYVYMHYVRWWKEMPDYQVQPGEVIHHIDGNRENNDICNLQKVRKEDHITFGEYRHGIMQSESGVIIGGQ